MSSSSMFNNNGISISISDDDPDEQGRMRVRVRRKRKKHNNHRVGNWFARAFIKYFVKFWIVLVFLLAIGLLLFETSRTSSNVKSHKLSRSKVNRTSSVKSVKKPSPDKTNLNRIEPVTHFVAGVRVNCLDLLPMDELQHLDIPEGEESTSPVKKVVYLSENNMPNLGGNNIISQQFLEGTRFNLFTGNQTLDQREKSFKDFTSHFWGKTTDILMVSVDDRISPAHRLFSFAIASAVNFSEVSETAEVHCGFCNEDGGFKISNEDNSYMESCKVVVSTCVFGGGDDLYQPIGMSDASLKKVCYVAFWDEVTLAAQESEGRQIGEERFIGKWRIVVVRDLPFTDQRLNGKIPKMLGHRLFPNAKYSIWVDSKSQFRRDPLGVLETLLWRTKSVLAISEHGARSSVYDEAKAVVKKNKALPEEVEVQLTQYRLDGLPQDKRFNGKKALSEASVIVREHTPLTNMFMCLWFNEVVRFTSRDQLSFPYVLWRLKVLKNINMFPVCTRKDLVNSMGHIRKAKPLVS